MSASTSAPADRIDEEAIDAAVATAVTWMLDQVAPALEDEDDGRRDGHVEFDDAAGAGAGRQRSRDDQEAPG